MSMKTNRKSYVELSAIPTFKERFEYLKLNGVVGEETFGCKRYLNQAFYRSKEWTQFRHRIIVRDQGCEFGLVDHPILCEKDIRIHHINPLTEDDVYLRSPFLLDPDNVISVSDRVHKALHYGSIEELYDEPTVRTKNDLIFWKRFT